MARVNPELLLVKLDSCSSRDTEGLQLAVSGFFERDGNGLSDMHSDLALLIAQTYSLQRDRLRLLIPLLETAPNHDERLDRAYEFYISTQPTSQGVETRVTKLIETEEEVISILQALKKVSIGQVILENRSLIRELKRCRKLLTRALAGGSMVEDFGDLDNFQNLESKLEHLEAENRNTIVSEFEALLAIAPDMDSFRPGYPTHAALIAKARSIVRKTTRQGKATPQDFPSIPQLEILEEKFYCWKEQDKRTQLETARFALQELEEIDPKIFPYKELTLKVHKARQAVTESLRLEGVDNDAFRNLDLLEDLETYCTDVETKRSKMLLHLPIEVEKIGLQHTYTIAEIYQARIEVSLLLNQVGLTEDEIAAIDRLRKLELHLEALEARKIKLTQNVQRVLSMLPENIEDCPLERMELLRLIKEARGLLMEASQCGMLEENIEGIDRLERIEDVLSELSLQEKAIRWSDVKTIIIEQRTLSARLLRATRIKKPDIESYITATRSNLDLLLTLIGEESEIVADRLKKQGIPSFDHLQKITFPVHQSTELGLKEAIARDLGETVLQVMGENSQEYHLGDSTGNIRRILLTSPSENSYLRAIFAKELEAMLLPLMRLEEPKKETRKLARRVTSELVKILSRLDPSSTVSRSIYDFLKEYYQLGWEIREPFEIRAERRFQSTQICPVAEKDHQLRHEEELYWQKEEILRKLFKGEVNQGSLNALQHAGIQKPAIIPVRPIVRKFLDVYIGEFEGKLRHLDTVQKIIEAEGGNKHPNMELIASCEREIEVYRQKNKIIGREWPGLEEIDLAILDFYEIKASEKEMKMEEYVIRRAEFLSTYGRERIRDTHTVRKFLALEEQKHEPDQQALAMLREEMKLAHKEHTLRVAWSRKQLPSPQTRILVDLGLQKPRSRKRDFISDKNFIHAFDEISASPEPLRACGHYERRLAEVGEDSEEGAELKRKYRLAMKLNVLRRRASGKSGSPLDSEVYIALRQRGLI